MEIINDNSMPEESYNDPKGDRFKHARRGERCGNIYLGLVLLLTGGLWLLHNFDLINYCVWDFFISWKMLLIVIGGYLLATRKWTAGAIMVSIGVIFMLFDIMNIANINGWKIVLPAILIILGISLLVSRLRK